MIPDPLHPPLSPQEAREYLDEFVAFLERERDAFGDELIGWFSPVIGGKVPSNLRRALSVVSAVPRDKQEDDQARCVEPQQGISGPDQRDDHRGDYNGPTCGFALYGPPAICTCGECDEDVDEDEVAQTQIGALLDASGLSSVVRRACVCSEPDPVMQADRKFYCYRCSFETGARPAHLWPESEYDLCPHCGVVRPCIAHPVVGSATPSSEAKLVVERAGAPAQENKSRTPETK